MTTKQKIGFTIIITLTLIGFGIVGHYDLKNIEADTKATACASLNDDHESIINCIQDN